MARFGLECSEASIIADQVCLDHLRRGSRHHFAALLRALHPLADMMLEAIPELLRIVCSLFATGNISLSLVLWPLRRD